MSNKLADFVKEYDTIIFDMDGVITSEENYWNTAALTIYEMLNSSTYFGSLSIDVKEIEKRSQDIRKEIFLDDKLISLLKEKGINTNWDLAYVVVCYCLLFTDNSFNKKDVKVDTITEIYNNINYIYSKEVFVKILNNISNSDISGMKIYEYISEQLSNKTGLSSEYFKRDGQLWKKCQTVFQEWYLGEDLFLKEYKIKPSKLGKEGLLHYEKPVVPLESLINVLEALKRNGIKMGIGTGRVYMEIHVPLQEWGIEHYFDKNMYITYSDVEEAEKNNTLMLNGEHLTKPHPFMFLKGILGKDYPDELIIKNEYKLDNNKTLIVGDAGSDIMAAQAIPCDFAAVLTGVSGEAARSYFEKMNSDFILNSICDFLL